MSEVFLNGKFVKESKAFIPITDHGFLYGDGIYETMRTYGNKIWQIKEHLERLTASAKLTNIKIPWSKKQIADWLEATVKKNIKDLKDKHYLRIRLSITRGSNNFDFMSTKEPTILISTQQCCEYEQEEGLKIVSYRGGRVAPNAKHLSQIINIMAKQEAYRQKCDDAIFADDNGFVSEGAFSNIFMVKRNRLITPDLDGILSGTTRKYILSFADQIARTQEAKVILGQLYEADEIFLSVTTKQLQWVSEIDGHKIGNGQIGPITAKIKAEFERRVDDFMKK